MPNRHHETFVLYALALDQSVSPAPSTTHAISVFFVSAQVAQSLVRCCWWGCNW